MHLSIVCQLGETQDRVGIRPCHISQYAPPSASGSRLKSKLPPWTLHGDDVGIGSRLCRYSTGLLFTLKLFFSIATFFLFTCAHFFFACAQCQMPHLTRPLGLFFVPKDCSQRELSNGLFSSSLGGIKAEIQLGTSIHTSYGSYRGFQVEEE